MITETGLWISDVSPALGLGIGKAPGSDVVIAWPGASPPKQQEPGEAFSADEWAARNFGQVNLGDQRLNQRAVAMASMMVAHPEESLPSQMEARSALVAAYGLLNNHKVTMEALLAPHCRQSLEAARRQPLVLMVEDTSELDFTAHRCMTGLGPIGDGGGMGQLLHSTLAVVPEGRRLLGLVHAQVVLRQPRKRRKAASGKKPVSRKQVAERKKAAARKRAAAQKQEATHWKRTPEAQVWETSARAVGSPPEGVVWVHVSDRGSDIFEYMVACIDRGKEHLVRAYHNRVLTWAEGAPQAKMAQAHYLLDYARSLTPSPEPGASYTIAVPATKKHPAREARVVMAWTDVTLPPPAQAPAEVRAHAPIQVSILRVWEPDPPPKVERVEWILLSSLPITSPAEAIRSVDWYSCRWLCEDYHQCLKTGCRVEHTQLDDAADVRRLLGFHIPIAVHLLQLRNAARETPDLPAKAVVEPLTVEVLAPIRFT